MKARIPNNNSKKLLCAGLTGEQTAFFEHLCSKTGAKLILASEEDMRRSPAELLGENVSPCTDTGYDSPDGTMLLFAGFDRAALDEALDLMKAAGVSIPLKAMYTPHNRLWSLAHLFHELSAEHNALHGGDNK